MTATAAPTELRKDPASGQWVLVRTGAIRTPTDGVCPFCPGREADTPAEVAAYRSNGQPPNSSDWLVRVIPERAPLLQIEGDICREGLGIFDKVSGRGASEIVIEHPDHAASWDVLSASEIERVLWMYRERMEDLYRDPQIRALLIIRRERTPETRITHPFSRIIGAPIVFDDIRRELATARHYYGYKQRCVYCDVVRQESRDGIRVIEQTTHFTVYAPYASRRPFETCVVPKTHRHRFEQVSSQEMADLARTLQGTSQRLHAALPDVPLELALHTAPNEAMRLRDDEWRTLAEDYHWHIEIVPDSPVKEAVGGFAVNRVPPEVAAKHLRDAL
jgi:UDPglucose--hexose-1-phosphate uridylyltransferase